VVLVALSCLALVLAAAAIRGNSPGLSAALLGGILVFLYAAGRKKAIPGNLERIELRALSSIKLPGGGRVHAVTCGGGLVFLVVSGGHVCQLRPPLPVSADIDDGFGEDGCRVAGGDVR
jgi:hypothetical protein